MTRMNALAVADEAFLRSAPERIHERATIFATPRRVFEALADTRRWSQWFPLMRAAAWCDGAEGGVGSERQVDLLFLGRQRERMIVWEQDARFAFTIVASSSPMVLAIAEEYRVSALGAQHAKLEWTFAVAPKAWVKPIAPIMRRAMSQLFQSSARSLNRYLADRSA